MPRFERGYQRNKVVLNINNSELVILRNIFLEMSRSSAEVERELGKYVLERIQKYI